MPIDQLLKSSYLSFGTKRHNGKMVDTPVWFAGDDQALFIFSAGDAGKVKRLKNYSTARVAPCTATGKRLGDWIPATAFIIQDEADIDTAYRALRAKYGWRMRMIDAASRIGGRYQQRVLICIHPGSTGDDARETAR